MMKPKFGRGRISYQGDIQKNADPWIPAAAEAPLPGVEAAIVAADVRRRTV